MNIDYRKPLPNAGIDFFDTREAVDAIEPGAYAKLPYTSRVLAENLVRKCAPEMLTDSLKQLIYRKRDLDFPWFPARVVCHDILGQTALVDLAGLRDAIAAKGGDPAKVNPVVPTQLIVKSPTNTFLKIVLNLSFIYFKLLGSVFTIPKK